MLKEVLVVEGKMDTVAIRKALCAETIETGGFALNPYTLAKIKAAYIKRGIIILTDPDGAGERIRKYLTEIFPQAGQAFVPKVDATANNDVGIEQASPEAIRKALSHDILYQASRNERLVNIISNLREQITSLRGRSMMYPGRLAKTLEEHRAIVDSIAQRDAEKAQRAVRIHMENAERTLLKAIEEESETE